MIQHIGEMCFGWFPAFLAQGRSYEFIAGLFALAVVFFAIRTFYKGLIKF